MRNSTNRTNSPASAATSAQRKPLGSYLVEAGLLTSGQVDVALNDQKMTDMRFGEILVARGWIKQQTVEYLMQKVILPEQQATHQRKARQAAAAQADQELRHVERETASSAPNPPTDPGDQRQSTRRTLPISKPLPSVGGGDGDVSWVG